MYVFVCVFHSSSVYIGKGTIVEDHLLMVERNLDAKENKRGFSNMLDE